LVQFIVLLGLVLLPPELFEPLFWVPLVVPFVELLAVLLGVLLFELLLVLLGLVLLPPELFEPLFWVPLVLPFVLFAVLFVVPLFVLF